MIGKEVGPVEFHVVAPVHVLVDTHGMFGKHLAAIGVIVEEAVGFRHGDTLEEFEMPQGSGPVAMRRLELNHGYEWLVLVSILLDPFQPEVGDEVVAMALVALAASIHLDEVRVVVGSLPRENTPEIETDRIGVQVPLSDHRDLVTGIAEELGEGLLPSVKVRRVVVEKAVQVAVLAGQDVGAGRAADGIGAEGIFEKHALRGDTVDVGGGCDLIEEPARVGRDGIAGVVIGEHEDDVGLLSRGGKSQCAECHT